MAAEYSKNRGGNIMSKKIIAFILPVIIIYFAGCTYKIDEKQDLWQENLVLNYAESANGYGTEKSSPIIEYNNSIYYVSKKGIVKISGKDEELIVPNDENSSVETIKIYNDLLYYSVYLKNEHTSCIKSAELNGQNQTIVFDGTLYEDFDWNALTPPSYGVKNIDNFYIFNDIIYIKSSTTSFQYNINEKSINGFIQDIISWAFAYDKFYYIDHAEKTFSIYEKDNLSDNVKLVQGDGISKRGTQKDEDSLKEEFLCDNVFECNSELYYTRRYPAQLYKYARNGDDILIADFSQYETDDYDGTLSVSVGNKNIYYIFDNVLYEYNTENGVSKQLSVISQPKKNITYHGLIVYENLLIYYADNDINNVKLIDIS